MQCVTLPGIGTDTAWRDAARALLAARVPPEDVLWIHGDAAPQLFATALPPPVATSRIKVPESFVSLAGTVVWHRDPERFARLYALLWRLRLQPGLMADKADRDVSKLLALEKNVQRCKHKMKAFVRFREIGARSLPRRRFAAWFEPTHHTVEPTAPFFARRFADMDWMIVTPDRTARFDNGNLSFHDGAARPDLPEDATEELWGTYFCNIFNPARVKIAAMTSEMPRKYWKNLPEAQHIPDLLAHAEARVREMQENAPTLPPLRAARILERLHAPAVHAAMTESFTFADLQKRAEEENRAALPGYGRLVLGEGPADAALMVVGEQPGDIEDQQGRPFVGPSGALFDAVAREVGLDRSAAYVTNAVKRFKFVQRGKRRIHQSPDRSDIEHARWWIAREIEIVKPALILSMGGTAAETLTGHRANILRRRGTVEDTAAGPVFLTVHPSFILRQRGAEQKTEETGRFRADLAAAQALLEDLRAG
jgi:uracil-DNA glycosylase